MEDQDIRWVQRFNNFESALSRLRKAVELSHLRPLSELEQQGLIQGFEFTHELAWKVIKDYLTDQDGADRIGGSKDATRAGLERGLISGGEPWMEMIESRNLSTHTYNEATANKIAERIIGTYQSLFEQFAAQMQTRRG